MEPVFNVVLPVFAIIFCGYLAGRFRILGNESTEALNAFVYYVALPVLLFYAMARVEPAEIFNWSYIGAFAGGSFVTLVIALAVSRLIFGRPLAEASMFGMNTVWSNTGYMGIPLTIVAFGADNVLPAIIATVFQSALLLGVIVALVEIARSSGAGAGAVVRDVLGALVRNPLIVAPLAGIGWSFLGVPLPAPIANFCEILGAAAGPCALFALGLFLYGKPLHEGAAEVGGIVFLKLVIHPLVTWWFLFHVFDVDAAWAAIGLLMAALPPGASSFVLAQKYGVFIQRTSAATLISTVLAVVTVSVLFTLPLMRGP